MQTFTVYFPTLDSYCLLQKCNSSLFFFVGFNTQLISFYLCFNVHAFHHVCVCFCRHLCIFMCSVWCHLFCWTGCLCMCVWSCPPHVVTVRRRFICTSVTLLRQSCRSLWGLQPTSIYKCQVVVKIPRGRPSQTHR